jgi:hypothetical protein
MYDTIYFIDGHGVTRGAPQCAEGHLLLGDLQTKDFECNLDTYYVFNRTLFLQPGGLGAIARRLANPELYAGPDYVRHDKALVITHKTVAELAPFTGVIHVYTHCRECLPVLVHSVSAGWNGGIVEHEPWCEFAVTFKDGQLTEITPVSVETRDQIKARLHDVLPDTDMVAQRHFEQKKAGRRR